MKFVNFWIDGNRKTSEIIQDVGLLKAISWIKAAWEKVSNQTVINCFRTCDFRNKPQDEDLQTWRGYRLDNASSRWEFWRQKLWKEIIVEKRENPAEEVIDVSSDEDVDEEIEDRERIKSASDSVQVIDKVKRF